MIGFIVGNLVHIGMDYILLENNNIGYRIFTSEQSILELEIGAKNVFIYTNMIVREDDISLYGFTTESESDMFKLLISVSRIGPKVALGVLSSLRPKIIKMAIVKDDIKTLCKAPGIGKKTAERLILELRDKIDSQEILDLDEDDDSSREDYSFMLEAIEALMTLGYSRYEVEKELKEMDLSGMNTEDIIRYGLKRLSK